jgi:nicotinate-nucleotide adenylyltransferase
MALAADPAAAPRRIGLLGGSFDPVHNAHLALASTAIGHLALHSLQFLPAAAPWQRQPLGAAADHRVRMLQLAIAHARGGSTGALDCATADASTGAPAHAVHTQTEAGSLSVNTIEIDRGGPTYTIDTLRAMGAGDTADVEYFWILGSDQLVNFCTWQAWREIVRRVRLAVAARPGSPVQAPAALARELDRLGHRLHTLPFEATDISATTIRRKVAGGLAVDDITPPPVAAYIETNHLYQAR